MGAAGVEMRFQNGLRWECAGTVPKCARTGTVTKESRMGATGVNMRFQNI